MPRNLAEDAGNLKYDSTRTVHLTILDDGYIVAVWDITRRHLIDIIQLGPDPTGLALAAAIRARPIPSHALPPIRERKAKASTDKAANTAAILKDLGL